MQEPNCCATSSVPALNSALLVVELVGLYAKAPARPMKFGKASASRYKAAALDCGISTKIHSLHR